MNVCPDLGRSGEIVTCRRPTERRYLHLHLLEKLLQYLKIMDWLRERAFESLKDGFTFLARKASSQGHWCEARSTALAGMCMALRENADSPWLQSISHWMSQQQIQDGCAKGSWGEEIWDTAMCIMALLSIQVSTRNPMVEAGLQWMAGLYGVNGRPNWHDEPWETSWALIAMLRAGRTIGSVDTAASMKWLLDLRSLDGLLVAPHYTAYFVMIEHLAARKLTIPNQGDFSKEAGRCAETLLDMLDRSDSEVLWAGEAWVNGQILWVLASTGHLDVTCVKRTEKLVNWFIAHQNHDGSWSDIEDTASAILGLHEIVFLLDKAADPAQHRRNIRSELQRFVPMPRLYLKRPLIERDNETGYFSLNLRESTVKWIAAAVLFFTVGLMGWIADLLQIIREFLPK